MKTIKVTTSFPQWPLGQQSPGRSGIWGGYRFVINEPLEECDFWVVFEGLPSEESTRCAPEAAILLTAEPPNVKTYDERFAAQFGVVLTAHPGLGGARRRLSPPCQPWHVGRHVTQERNLSFDKDYDFLRACPVPAKTGVLSVISSDKAFTAEHQYRLEFLRALQSAFGDRIDVFGRGIRDVEDKWDAIAPYRYHVVLENGAFPDYWTEKISDAYLAWSFPLYMGSPNLSRYFPAPSFVELPWGDAARAISVIESVIRRDPFEQSLPHLDTARRKCLDEYNFFPYIAAFCDTLRAGGARRTLRLAPESAYRSAPVARRPRLLRRIAGFLNRSRSN